MFKPVYNADMPGGFTDSAGKPVLHHKPCNIQFLPKLEILQRSNSTRILVFIKKEKNIIEPHGCWRKFDVIWEYPESLNTGSPLFAM